MTKIPKRKKSPEELSDVRRLNAVQNTAMESTVMSKVLHPAMVVLGYLASLGGLGILLYPIIVWRKPLSSHHGGFMCLVSVLILASAGVYTYERSFDVVETEDIPDYISASGDSSETGSKPEMSMEELDAYLELLRQENEKDPDFQKRQANDELEQLRAEGVE